ncbi:MAG: cupin [bacterium]|nr:MAG: cupin [bacterium]
MDSKPKVNLLTELINYADDAVVSKTIIKKETGTVTLFAFDKDQELSEHTAPFDALVLVLDGVAEIKISGIPYILKKGEMIILPVNKSHSLKAVEKFKMMLTMIRS